MKILPRRSPTSKAGRQLVEACTSYSNLTTRFQASLADLEIAKCGPVSVWKDESVTVIAEFEKELDAVQKKLDDYEARRGT